MSREMVGIIPTGVANIASIQVAFERLGFATENVQTPAEVVAAARLVLPGVGSFASGMAALQHLELVDSLRRRIREGRPTLAICLGFQLLCTSSDESPGVAGLGILPVNVRRFAQPSAGTTARPKRVPHLGWNQVRVAADMSFPEGAAYFAHSYYVSDVPENWRAAHCEYDETFVAAAENGSVWACQFHPELSSNWGGRILQAWLQAGAAPC